MNERYFIMFSKTCVIQKMKENGKINIYVNLFMKDTAQTQQQGCIKSRRKII